MIPPEIGLWLTGGDTGASSKTIVRWLEYRNREGASYPLDSSDLGRCIRLLDIYPPYRVRIGEMAALDPVWAALVARWGELEALYRTELPTGHAPICYSLMQRIIREAQNARLL